MNQPIEENMLDLCTLNAALLYKYNKLIGVRNEEVPFWDPKLLISYLVFLYSEDASGKSNLASQLMVYLDYVSTSNQHIFKDGREVVLKNFVFDTFLNNAFIKRFITVLKDGDVMIDIKLDKQALEDCYDGYYEDFRVFLRDYLNTNFTIYALDRVGKKDARKFLFYLVTQLLNKNFPNPLLIYLYLIIEKNDFLNHKNVLNFLSNFSDRLKLTVIYRIKDQETNSPNELVMININEDFVSMIKNFISGNLFNLGEDERVEEKKKNI